MSTTQDPVIDILFKGSTLNGAANIPAWKGLRVERRLAEPSAREEDVLDAHYIILWCAKPTIADREYKPGRFERVVKRPGTLLSVLRAAFRRFARLLHNNVVASVVEEDYLTKVSDEVDGPR